VVLHDMAGFTHAEVAAELRYGWGFAANAASFAVSAVLLGGLRALAEAIRVLSPGRRPFRLRPARCRADPPAALLRQHSHPPVAPSWHCEASISPALGEPMRGGATTSTVDDLRAVTYSANPADHTLIPDMR
jgi:hypothetical protein